MDLQFGLCCANSRCQTHTQASHSLLKRSWGRETGHRSSRGLSSPQALLLAAQRMEGQALFSRQVVSDSL